MILPSFKHWMVKTVLACAAMGFVTAFTSQAQHRWLNKPRTGAQCPVEVEPILPPLTVPPATRLPEIKPPVELPPEPTAAPVTTAALGGDVSINMFGDQGTPAGSGSLQTISPRSGIFSIYSENSKGTFVAPIPKGALAFGKASVSPIPYFVAPGQGPGPVFPKQTYTLPNNQPNINSQLNGANPNYQIRNGIATINSPANINAPLMATVKWDEVNQANGSLPGGGAGGGVVGRQKISEDINPLPRDRFIFNFDHFNNTPLTSAGLDTQRYVLGIEKTFFNQLASLEVRVPFATTMSSDMVLGAENKRTEFGDVRVMLKFLLYNSQTVHVASGLAAYLPTASDVLVSQQDGTPLVHIDNRALLLTPFVGVLFTPSNRWFGQAWFAIDFDTTGNPVKVADQNYIGLQNVGRLRDQTYMQWDGQFGYWLLQPSQGGGGLLQGLAPFVELHYGSTMNNADLIQTNGFVIGNLANRVDELNLSAGFAAVLHNNVLISAGAAAPLRQANDRAFDYQVGVRASLLFGNTAAQRPPGVLASTF